MGLIIMAHAQNGLHEYFLPAINDSDYSIVLNKSTLGLPMDVSVLLEVVNHVWSFKEAEIYRICDFNNELYFKKKISNGQSFILELSNGFKITLIALETSSSMNMFQKYDISRVNSITIGKSEENFIRYSLAGYVSRNHANIVRTNDGWYVYDNSSNGTFMNHRRLVEPMKLKFGDTISIFGLKVIFLERFIGISALAGEFIVDSRVLQLYTDTADSNRTEPIVMREQKYYKRSPRKLPNYNTDVITIEAPPSAKVSKKKPLFMQIGPSFTMAIPMMLGCGITIYARTMSGGSASAFMFTGIITSVGSACMGVFWALTNLRYNKKMETEDEEIRYNSYGEYLIEQAQSIRDSYEHNQKEMLEAYPDAATCCGYDSSNSRLWERNTTHNDFLFVRLGIGDIPFQAPIQVPEKKFTLIKDDLAGKPAELKKNYSILYQVPVGIDLLRKPLWGVIGGSNRIGSRQVLLDMVAQIAANNAYTDVKMVFIYENHNEEDEKFWEFIRWLPHVWTDDRKARLISSSKAEVGDLCYELTNILRMREENKPSSSDKGGVVVPHFVIFVDDLDLLEGQLLLKYIKKPLPEYGITSVIMVDKYEDLPNYCENIIQNDDIRCGFYNVAEDLASIQKLSFDQVSVDAVSGMARTMADIFVNESSAAADMPNSLDFFQMYDVAGLDELNVYDRWTKNRTYDSIKAVIGKKGGNQDCYLDIHEKFHGPHGLVAGTTGSGKSETLQTYILSLCVNFSPDDIGFFIIDFKGGGMANLFSNLPHMSGQISNLSGNQVRRAMISIKSENKRRQRLFTENGVNNINLYTRLYKNNEATTPIPHLFIIIDEFAELKREEPEFMKELISVAQVGRSLGVHLILATQKPSGTVDDNIWSNSKFRLCLRVQDRQDSNDMLHKPDAAYITQAGRGYLQVGNDELYELFQSGYSGAVYEEGGSTKLNIANMLTISGRTALVGNKTERMRKEKAKQIWLVLVANCFIEEAAKEGTTPGKIAKDKNAVKIDTFCRRVVRAIVAKNVIYEETEYNVERLKDFLKMWSDMDSPEETVAMIMLTASLSNTKLPEQKEQTQLDAIVDYLGKLAKEKGYSEQFALWLPVLPLSIPLKQLKELTDYDVNKPVWKDCTSFELEVPIGLYDDPENQLQDTISIDFAQNGHYAVIGSVGTGKSTFLQTALMSMFLKYSPKVVNTYILDFSSGALEKFKNAPHVGSVMFDEEFDKYQIFFHYIEEQMNKRKEMFRGSNYSQYVRVHGITIPAIVLVIDNYSSFSEKTSNSFDQLMLRYVKEGISYGMYLLCSAGGFGMMEIPNRVNENIREIYTLDLGDKAKYSDVLRTNRIPILPENGVKGRGLAYVNGRMLEYQTCVALDATDDYDRLEKIEKICEVMKGMYKGSTALGIRQIPETPTLKLFLEDNGYQEVIDNYVGIPVCYRQKDASLFVMDFKDTCSFVVSGKGKTGKTNVLKLLLAGAKRYKGAQVGVVETEKKDLLRTTQNYEFRYMSEKEDIWKYYQEFLGIFKERLEIKRKYEEEGNDAGEIFDKMKELPPVFVFLADGVKFVEAIYHREVNVPYLAEEWEKAVKDGGSMNMYVIFCLNTEEAVGINGFKIMKIFGEQSTGIHLGGSLDQQRIFPFKNVRFADKSQPMKVGLGMAASYSDKTSGETVVIPSAKEGE